MFFLRRVFRFLKRKLFGTSIRHSECGMFGPNAQVNKSAKFTAPRIFI